MKGLRNSIRLAGAALCMGSSAACSDVSGVELKCKAAIDCTFTEGGFSLLIPAAAIPGGLDLKATRVTNPPDSATIVPGTSWDLQPEGTTFTPRAIVAVVVHDSLLSRVPGVRASELRVYRREGLAWVPVDSQSTDSTQRVVTARLSGFSTYTVMGVPATSVTIAPGQSTIVIGSTTPLTATVRSATNAVLPARVVEWSSSNDAVATVSSAGVVTGVSAGTVIITARSGTAQSTSSVTVNTPPVGPPPPPPTEPTPGAGDVVVYDDDFSGFSTLALRRAQRNALVSGAAPFYFYDGPDPGSERAILDSIIAPGYAGSPFAYRLRVPADYNNFRQATMNSRVFYRSPTPTTPFNPAGTTLVVDMWLRVNYPTSALYWIKGLELFHSFDRTQYSIYLTGGSLGWGNIHPQSNNKEIYFHVENGAADAPTRFRRWTDITTNEWRKHTFVYKASSGTGTARDGVARWYVDGERLIDASLTGLNTGWMMDRQNGVASNSTSPYPGNVGDKYSNTTGDQALLGLSDDPVINIVFPGIFSTSAAGGGGTIDIGRIRVWYRP